MKTAKMLAISVLALGLMIGEVKAPPPPPPGPFLLSTAFTYQGHLYDNNDVADGLYDFQFSLYDANSGGSQVGSDANKPDVDVIDAYFTVELDFGCEVFDGNDRWLEIGVRPGELSDSNAYTPLSPRQQVTAVPYALQTRGIFVDSAGNVGIGTTSPSFKLDVEGSARFWNSTGGRSGVQIGTTSGSGTAIEGIASDGNLTQDMWINYQSSGKVILAYGGGNVGIGRTPILNDLEVEGTASKTVVGDWLANSDVRIKADIQTVTGALETLDKVRLVSFKYTDDYQAKHPSIEKRRYLNVIAQEFREVFPEYVKSSGEKLANGEEILQVDAYPLTVYSAAAVQELHAMAKDKDAEIAALKDRLSKLETMMAKFASEQEGWGL